MYVKEKKDAVNVINVGLFNCSGEFIAKLKVLC